MQYGVGDRISYEAFGGEVRTGTVTEKHDDVKKGRPGFDMVLPDGTAVWGYDDQITEVLR